MDNKEINIMPNISNNTSSKDNIKPQQEECNITQIEKKGSNIIFTLFLPLIVTLFGGFYLGLMIAPRDMNIVYISKQELLAFEHQRLEKSKNKNQQLFFGKMDKFFEEVKLQKVIYEDKKYKVLLADGAIYGDKVESISDIIYKNTITKLQSTIIKGKN